MNYGESLIAFLGYLHSPKWSKLNISYRKSSNNILLRRKSKNITNLTNLTFKRFNSSLVKPLNKECSHLTEYPGLNTLVNSQKLTDFFKEKQKC
jgi:hypothetical protein